MIYIKKGPPPNDVSLKLAEIKRDPNWKSFPEFPPEDPIERKGYASRLRENFFDQIPKHNVRSTLLKEQHHLCAYCMRRLKNEHSVVIEHWLPLQEGRDSALDYNNFLGSCKGIYFDGHQNMYCCDRSKNGDSITIDPRNEWMMDCIKYERNGTIYFDAPARVSEEDKRNIDNDINNILCLNGIDSELKLARSKVYQTTQDKLKKLQSNNKSPLKAVTELVNALESTDTYPEYAGVMLFCLKRWLKNHKQ